LAKVANGQNFCFLAFSAKDTNGERFVFLGNFWSRLSTVKVSVGLGHFWPGLPTMKVFVFHGNFCPRLLLLATLAMNTNDEGYVCDLRF